VDVLALARWQFAITTIYHFFLVPLTIGLGPIVAGLQTAWVVTGNERWLRLTKFFGKLFVINFALGVATGIVQEFQFGMAWSEYSRFVGDVFGAPLAMEALAAFFIESTFLGLWIFGWGRLNKKVHLACVWAVAFAAILSAYFILAANSWMQHPVGVTFNPETGRAEMESIGAVLTNNTLLAAFSHTITASFVVAGTVVCAVAAWWMVRLARSQKPELLELARTTYRPAVVIGAVVTLVAGVGILISGDIQGKLMYQQQPGKMSAAEVLCHSEEGAAFTLLAVGPWDPQSCDEITPLIQVPGVASWLGTGHFSGPESRLPGTLDVQASMEARFGATDDAGNPISYIPRWACPSGSFRLMIGLGTFSAALGVWALWLTRRGRVSDNRWFSRLALVAIPMPYLACAFGWIFTEVGRQPWVVAPNPTGIDAVSLLTQRGVSTVVPAGVILASMIGFTLLYAALGVIWFRLMHRYAVEGVPEVHDEWDRSHRDPEDSEDDEDGTRPLTFAY